uniref:NEDD4-binding protein 2-like 1 n=1 Tax=Cacopsylla melanoneura TaxID=428564 RepID=A0A8D8WHY6_9HEMI
MLFVMRGLPGSGKTTKIQTLTKHIQEALGDHSWAPKVFSADDYFMTERGYVYDKTKLCLAHPRCYRLSENSVMRHESPVIIDNTNLTKEDMKRYYDLAYYNWYKFYVIEPDSEWAFNIDTLIKKGVHDVPKFRMVNMMRRYFIPDGFETFERYEDDSSFYFTGLQRSDTGDSQNDGDRDYNSPRSRSNSQRKSGGTDGYFRKAESHRRTPEYRQHHSTEDSRLVQYKRKTSPEHSQYSSQRKTPEYRQHYNTEDSRLVQYKRKTSPEHNQYRSQREKRSTVPRSDYYDRKSYTHYSPPSRNDKTEGTFNTGHSPENEDLERKLNAKAEEDLWKYDLLGDYGDIPLPSNEFKKENECMKDTNIQLPTVERQSTSEQVEKDNDPVDDMSSKSTVVIEEKVKERMKKQLNYFLKHRQDCPKSVDKDGVHPKSAEDNKLHFNESNECKTEQDDTPKCQETVNKPKIIQIKLGSVKSVNDIVSSGSTLTSKHTNNECVVASVTDKTDKPALDEETLNTKEGHTIKNETSKTDLNSEAHDNGCEKPDIETCKDKLSNKKESENGEPNKGEEEVGKPESDSEEGELSSEHSDNEENGDNQVTNNAPEAENEPEPEEEEIEEGEILDNDSEEEDGKSKAGSDDDIEIIGEETSSSLPSTTSTKRPPKRDVEKNRLRKQLMAIEEKIKAARRTKRRRRRKSSSSSSSSGSSGSGSSSSRSRSSSSDSSSS